MPMPYRLFCLPHAGAGASAYRDWADRLGDGVQVFALHPPGRERRFREPLRHSVRELVEDVIDTVGRQAREATAGFGVFGHSMGALVAYELAHALVARGLTPERLVVSGYRAPHLPSVQPWVHQLPTAELVCHLAKLEGTATEVLGRADMLELVLPVIRADYEVCETYSHPDRQPLPMPMMALGGDCDPGVTEADVRAWGGLTVGTFSVRMFPGGHFYLHNELAAVLDLVAPKKYHSSVLRDGGC